jgi:hypothetical protein
MRVVCKDNRISGRRKEEKERETHEFDLQARSQHSSLALHVETCRGDVRECTVGDLVVWEEYQLSLMKKVNRDERT